MWLRNVSRLFFTAVIVFDCMAKSNFINVYSCRHSLNDIIRATDVVFGGKRHGNVGKGCSCPLRGSDARMFIAECDPSASLPTCMEFPSGKPLSVVSEIDNFVSLTDFFVVTTLEHMKVLASCGSFRLP